MRVNKTKYFLVVGILLAVAGLTLGFAAFSNTLTIQSSATVTPDASTFSVKFSSSPNSVVEGGIAGNGAYESSTAIINNNGNPTLSNINVNWTDTVEFIVYSFYVYNNGEYDAYLNEIIFNNVDGSNKKVVCTIPDGAETTQSLVDQTCESLYHGIAIVNQDTYEYLATPYDTETFSGIKLEKGSSYLVEFTLYPPESLPDGDLNVSYGDIEMVWSSADVNAS